MDESRDRMVIDEGAVPAAEAGTADEHEADALDALTEMSEDLKRKLAQAHAEIESVRRRAQEDIARAHKYAIEAFAREVLHVKDALETACGMETGDSQALRTGLELCLRRLEAALARTDW